MVHHSFPVNTRFIFAVTATDTDSSSLGAPRSHPLSAGRTRHPENTRSINSTITTTTNDQEYDADSDFSRESIPSVDPLLV